MAGHLMVSIQVQVPGKPDTCVEERIMIRDDLMSPPADPRKDAGQNLTMQRIGEAFTKAYIAAVAAGNPEAFTTVVEERPVH